MLGRISGLLLVCSVSCASSGKKPNAAHYGDDVVARGGELRVEEMPGAGVQVTEEGLVVWAMTELPGNSRMQAAHAAIDAITRAELIKFLEVHVASLMEDVATDDAQHIELTTVEAVHGTIIGSAPIRHGWVKARREGDIVLRLVARMDVPKAMLENAITSEPRLAGDAPWLLKAMLEATP
ncbi:MAG: hypothetical protein V3T05_08010 [Myxococcota bacterium]